MNADAAAPGHKHPGEPDGPDIQAVLGQLVAGQSLTQEAAAASMREVMSGRATPAQTAALLTALKIKGETPAEIAGAAQTMRAFCTPVPVAEAEAETLIDTCGTGGSGAKLFNVSTAAALVAAAAGARVAKHGNRKASSDCGSADLLEAAGVNVDLAPDQVGRCIREVGIGFLFAQRHHPAMRHAGPIRQELRFRTMMNLLGPLTNPAGARRQVIGVFSPDWLRPLAEVLKLLGAEHVLLAHGGGLDELVLDGPSEICELKAGEIRSYRIAPEDLGLRRRDTRELRADSVASSLALVHQSLTDADSAAADLVSLNAGAAIHVAGLALSHADGIEMARDAIASGLARETLSELVRVTRLMAEST